MSPVISQNQCLSNSLHAMGAIIARYSPPLLLLKQSLTPKLTTIHSITRIATNLNSLLFLTIEKLQFIHWATERRLLQLLRLPRDTIIRKSVASIYTPSAIQIIVSFCVSYRISLMSKSTGADVHIMASTADFATLLSSTISKGKVLQQDGVSGRREILVAARALCYALETSGDSFAALLS